MGAQVLSYLGSGYLLRTAVKLTGLRVDGGLLTAAAGLGGWLSILFNNATLGGGAGFLL